MNKKIFMITFMLMLFLFVGTSSAYEQIVEIKIFTTESDIDDENVTIVWNQYGTTIDVSTSEIFTVLGNSIKLIEIANDGNSAFFQFTNIEESFLLGNLESTSDNKHIYEDLKIELVDIGESKTISTTTDNVPVAVWIEPSIGDKKHLTANGVNSFNPVEYGSNSGWTTTYEKEEVILYAERLEDVIVAFNMESNGEWESEEKDNLIKFYLKSNAEYVFTIEYTEIGLWWGETDTTDIYVISISGLGETTTQSSSNDNTATSDNSDDSKPIVEGDYRLNVGDSKNIITDEDGEWTLDTGYTINPNIANDKYVWTFDFSREGNYRPEFTSDSGETGFVDFNIQLREETANIVQGTDNSSNAGKVVALLGLVLILIGGLLLLQKKKGSKFSMKKSDSSSSVSPVEKDFI